MVHLAHQYWAEKTALSSPRPLRPLKRRGRLINRPLQPMKTGGNNPDKRQIWSLSYKTNFNCAPFFKSSSGWRTRELNPCGCRICFSLIALSGYLIRWRKTKTPPFTDKFALFLSLWHTNCSTQCILCLPIRILSYTSPQGYTHTHNRPFAKLLLVPLSSFPFSHGTYAVYRDTGGHWN